MIRKLITIGLITGFIASAFVTPTDAHLKSMTALAKDEIRERTSGSLFGGATISSKDAQAAAKILTAVASDPALKKAAIKAAGSASSLKNVGEAVTVLTSVSTKPTVKAVVKSVAKAVTGHRITPAWKNYRASADPFTVSQMERIEWALKKHDVRLCHDVYEEVAQAPNTSAISAGDYLALCVAMVTADPIRCTQILPSESSTLNSLCYQELDSV